MSRTLIVFARQPVPGQVKTRLQARWSPEECARLYAAFLEDTIALAGRSRADVRVLAFEPADAGDAMSSDLPTTGAPSLRKVTTWAVAWRFALTAALSGQGDTAVLIGSDLPSLPSHHIDDAFALLDDRDVVLGPTMDGGYYLVGLSTRDADIFTDMTWSTSRVFADTVSRVEQLDLSLGLAPPWYDVDTPEDVDFLANHARARILAGEDCLVSARRVLKDLVPGTLP